jgi:hypothetical protein
MHLTPLPQMTSPPLAPAGRARHPCVPGGRERRAATRAAAGVALAALAALAPVADAQMPGVPVLQNAFANAGTTVAANYGHVTGANAYAAAVAWAPGSARFVVSAGGGVYDPSDGDTRPAYGARLAFPVAQFTASRSLGVAVFAGGGAATHSGVTLAQFPVGAALGFRHALGATRTISAYAAPFYLFARTTGNGSTDQSSVFRVSAGLDVTLLPTVGATIGYESGSTGGRVAPASGIFGVGLSYLFRR